MATQELVASFKVDVGTDGSGSNSPYGTAQVDEIIIEKKSSQNKSQFYLHILTLMIALAALIAAIVAVTKSNTTSDNQAQTESHIGLISRTLILQQFSFEQRLRSVGDSGITNVRQHVDGNEIYNDGTYSNGAAIAIHDHADWYDHCGLGEIQAVLNGVEFQTRHNDYKLVMSSTTSSEFGAIESVPFPEVPPEVLNAGDINAQIIEMQEWFRAFKTQNKSHRYYPDYFKPLLCYLEGAWVNGNGAIQDPSASDRHEIDADSWQELHDKMRWMTNSGRKDPNENLARLPSAIRNIDSSGKPIISNWEYRILCHPLKNDVPLDRLRVSDDLSVQLQESPMTRKELLTSRRARFEISKYINLTDPDSDESYPMGYWQPGVKKWNYLDYLMEQIPGKDNYMGELIDELPDGSDRVVHFNDDSEINSAYYNRFYSLTSEDAMGTTGHRRGYADRYLFAAKTSQERISPVSFKWLNRDDGSKIQVTSRWSWAIPLEIVYLNPIRKWNPYNITQIPRDEFPSRSDVTGLCSENDPFPGWMWHRAAYFTPPEFYESVGATGDADTASSDICVLDPSGVSHPLFASGQYIFTPNIGNGVGSIRTRYPIFPIHGSSNPGFKEAKALETLLLDEDYDNPKNNSELFGNDRDIIYGFEIRLTGDGGHVHYISIAGWQVVYNWYDENGIAVNGSDYTIVVDTTSRNSHQHTLEMYRYRTDVNSQDWIYKIMQCAYGTISNHGEYMDGQCADGHNMLIRGFA